MKQVARWFVFALLGFMLQPASADFHDILMVRLDRPFDESIQTVRTALERVGFDIAKIQRVDKAMKKIHYETSEYRIIHFGIAEENSRLLDNCPALIAWLPLRITLASEREQTLLVTLNPGSLAAVCGDDPLFNEWQARLHQVIGSTH